MSKKRRKLNKYVLWTVLAVFGAGFIAAGLWVWKLDQQITEQFEGRRWSLPAQVFAEPLELYAGQSLSAAGLERELRRLGYQQSTSAPKTPGTYRRRNERIDLVSRRFEFYDEDRPATAVSVVAQGDTIQGILSASGAQIDLFRLDPLLIGSIFPRQGEDRVVVTPEEVPPLLPVALKIVEDRKFDTHHGINPTAVARALWVNIRAGRAEQGASTITQQLVKSYFLSNERKLKRKINEAAMAMLLEVHFEKDDLMNAYINEIYLAQDGSRAIHGFGLASQFYFGKPLNELNLQEIALLVAEVRGPSYYDPRRKKSAARALERRNLVLKLLAEFKAITPEQAEAASKTPLGVTTRSGAGSGYNPAFLDLVRRTLRRDYPQEQLTQAGLRVFSTLNPQVQARTQQILNEELTTFDKRKKAPKDKKLEGVVVVTAPQKGEVIAMVGSRQAGVEGFNRALDSRRSIGSLVKPIIYLAALETGRYNAASIVEDSPIEVELGGGRKWRPKNSSREANGPVPMVMALAQSLNLATVQLGMDVGLPAVTKEFVKLGLEKEPEKIPAVLLGALFVSPLEVAQMYNSLANGGFRTPLRAVRKVVDADGKVVERRRENSEGVKEASFALNVTQVADPATVWQVNRMMVETIERGTGRGARTHLPAKIIAAGKTGTSSDYRDSWFAGFTSNHLAVIWIGYDDGTPTGLSGATAAAPVWGRVMASLQPRSWDTTVPEGLENVSIDYRTGFEATAECTGASPIVVAVPIGTVLPPNPTCGQQDVSTAVAIGQ